MISKKLRDKRFEIIDRMNREKTKKGKLALRLEFEATIKYKKSCVRKLPALVSRKAVLTDSLGDLKQMLPYRGGRYDKSKFTLVRNGWDHEHCNLCWKKLFDGDTWWQACAPSEVGLCVRCHAKVMEFKRRAPEE